MNALGKKEFYRKGRFFLARQESYWVVFEDVPGGLMRRGEYDLSEDAMTEARRLDREEPSEATVPLDLSAVASEAMVVELRKRGYETIDPPRAA